ncbi:poly-beta-1,6-N-acetyl-D-glucosamine synthase [Lysobacter auxotrophicus]|uniref:Poly-beta-1,6-N-acetyl-D-glucosamine synthase n=1 Tax=Lysobacter auxotrophicus TaxID=2992573 RepID=A0ABM8DDM0_9GAMM|nr:poly-beta-1,6-N-acetyl-D-glucosamine synthase [Lysobacter auxotrophicus]BDU16697.1 poly-beta-1,6-N-acetyl-D-glucosamine synthase [Lysobacter auxotrophicus]
MNVSGFELALAALCFGYPYVMSWYWIIGGVLFQVLRERREPPFDRPPALAEYPPVSVLVPCYNESHQVDETIAALDRVAYPDFEIVAIDDGSSDDTARRLATLATRYPRLRVVRMARNGGKSVALNYGALAARHELLAIDGDTLLDPHAITWFVRRFQNDPRIGGITGNPRIRNRTSVIGRLQVGEFSSIVGLIKRAQSVYGSLFTASGSVCAYRKGALHDAGWWSPRTITDDVDISWRLQMCGWRMAFEPKALAWILTPETLRGLWRQRLRWSEGGSDVALRAFPSLFRAPGFRMWPVWLNWAVSIAWAYAMLVMLIAWWVGGFQFGHLFELRGFGFFPGQAGMLLAVHYLLQAVVAASLDRRYEHGIMRTLFWVVWYPLVFWLLQATTAVVGLPRAIFRRGRRGVWTSPDRGFRT